MQKRVFRKGVIVAILILFVGTIIIPAIQGNINNIDHFTNQKKPIDDTDFDKKIKLLMRLSHIPSLSISIIKNNTNQWSKAYGYSNVRNKIPAKNDSVYMIASISKTFAATAILQLYEQGLFDLDDNICEYLPFDLKNPKYPDVNITFRMLLSHHSSLSRFLIGVGSFFAIIGTPNEWLKEFLVPTGRYYIPQIWKNYPPGEKYLYSDLGFEIIEYLVERISKQPFDKYCKEHILEPLNMSNSSYHLKDYELDKIATLYMWILGMYIPLPMVEISSYAAGGLRSTVIDLSKYLLMHMNNGTYDGVKILDEKTIKEMHTPQLGHDSYGLGWVNTQTSEGYIYGGHTGKIFGVRAEMWYRRFENTGVIMLWNECRMIDGPIENRCINIIFRLLWEKAENL